MSRHASHGSPDAPAQHRAYAPKAIACAVLTVSDSRTVADDSSGKLIAELLGGRLEVTSQSGRTCFRLVLPAADTPSGHVQAPRTDHR